MKIGALASSLRLPLLETFDAYRQMGLQGVQIGVNMEFLACPDEKIEEIKARCKMDGLTISAICGDIGGHAFQTQGENMKRAEFLCRVVDLAGRLETHVITTHIGVVPEDRNDPVYPLMLESIRHAANYAADRDVTFAIETGPEKPETLKTFIEEVNSKGLGVNLDPANFVMVTGQDPVEAVQVLGKYIVHTHAKDGVMLKQTDPEIIYDCFAKGGIEALNVADYFLETPLGDGDVDYAKYINALRGIGYDGYLTIERETGENPISDIQKSLNTLRNII